MKTDMKQDSYDDNHARQNRKERTQGQRHIETSEVRKRGGEETDTHIYVPQKTNNHRAQVSHINDQLTVCAIHTQTLITHTTHAKQTTHWQSQDTKA